MTKKKTLKNSNPAPQTVKKKSKLTIHEKKLILFPDLSEKKRQDEYLAEFLAKAEAGEELTSGAKMIDPDELEYNFPDFGFDNELTFIEFEPNGAGTSNYWKFFGDYSAPFPKFQRLRNYIKFVTDRKNEELKALEKAMGSKYHQMPTLGHRGTRMAKGAGMNAARNKQRLL